jgi:hypothetical protein
VGLESAPDAFSQRPLSRACRPFMRPISKARLGSRAVVGGRCDEGLRRADSTRTRGASGRTGIRAIAGVPLPGRRRPVEPCCSAVRSPSGSTPRDVDRPRAVRELLADASSLADLRLNDSCANVRGSFGPPLVVRDASPIKARRCRRCRSSRSHPYCELGPFVVDKAGASAQAPPGEWRSPIGPSLPGLPRAPI